MSALPPEVMDILRGSNEAKIALVRAAVGATQTAMITHLWRRFGWDAGYAVMVEDAIKEATTYTCESGVVAVDIGGHGGPSVRFNDDGTMDIQGKT